MTMQLLTEDKAIMSIRSFFREIPFVFIGTGMSCAVDSRFGMEALRDALQVNKSLSDNSKTWTEEWQHVLDALAKGIDLENALYYVNDQDLLKEIISITGKFISEIDREYAYLIAKDEVGWPAMGIIKKIYDTLPDSEPFLHILTPNYDMLIEYACEQIGITYSNGFWGGISKSLDWNVVSLALHEAKKNVRGKSTKTVFYRKKHCLLYKVHGSLNYFFYRNAIVENNAWAWCPPEFAERVLITPGLTKYQSLQQYRQELIQKPDSAIEKAVRFLFLGYGFNDSHLEVYINRKLANQSCHGLIITRDSNSRIEDIVNTSSNLWLVCKPKDMKQGTRISNSQFQDCIIPEKNFWNVQEFAVHILGV